MRFDNIIKILAVSLVLLTCIIAIRNTSEAISGTSTDKENFAHMIFSGYILTSPCNFLTFLKAIAIFLMKK